MEDLTFTAREVAERLKLSRRTVYRLIARKEIPTVRLGGQYRIPAAALEKRLEVPEAMEG